MCPAEEEKKRERRREIILAAVRGVKWRDMRGREEAAEEDEVWKEEVE